LSLSPSGESLPALDESDLEEDLFTSFGNALRATSCVIAGDTFVPAVRFACFDGRFTSRGNDTEARVLPINDGIKTVARSRAVIGAIQALRPSPWQSTGTAMASSRRRFHGI
jgi:hypothetical protein